MSGESEGRIPGFARRTAIVVGEAGLEALAAAKVSVYGLGGVGAACAMDLVRAGVGRIRAVDFDRVEISNLNRLCIGFSSTVGETKVAAFSRLAREVNPAVEIEGVEAFFSGEDAAGFVDAESGWHADCVDSLNPKVRLIAGLQAAGARFISSMGTAGRLAPERLRFGDIWETEGCPLAKSVRARLRRMGLFGRFPVVWSDEPPVKPVAPGDLRPAREGIEDRSAAADSGPGTALSGPRGPAAPRGRPRLAQGSSPFVPQTAGHLLASWIVRDILSLQSRG